MSKKMYALLMPVLAVAALAMSAGAAQAANPHWFVCEKLATETGKFTDSECEKAGKGFWELKEVGGAGAKVRVATYGVLTLKIGGAGGPEVKCFISDRGKIWNVVAGGLDEITFFEAYECESASCPSGVTITGAGFPWPTELVAGPLDKIGTAAKPIKITVNCTGVLVETFEGELSPKFINPSTAEFAGATSGELKGSGGNKATVTGKDFAAGVEHNEAIFAK